MEAPSASAHRGLILWKELLLAVSLLTFWSPPTTAQLTIASINAAEGKDVVLLVLNLPENLVGYAWYRGESVDSNHRIASYVIETQKLTLGPAHTGRERIYANGSLLFQKVSLKNTGSYTMQALKPSLQADIATGQLRVYQPVRKPSIQAGTTITEHKDTMVLTCLTNDTGISIRWFFRDQSLLLTERMKVSWDNRTLTIEPIRREDAGGYQCEVSNPVSASKSDPLRPHGQTENDLMGYFAVTIAAIVIGVLVLVALGTYLGYFLYRRRTMRATDPRGLREHRPPASTPGHGPSGAYTSQGPLPSTRTAGPIYENLQHLSTDMY